MTTSNCEFWAVVPAAGKGRRMGGETPKQYQSLAGEPMLHHTLKRLGQIPGITGIVLVLAGDDVQWQDTDLALSVPLYTVDGGETRADSVLAGVEWLMGRAPHAWALVHDAARPGVRKQDVLTLMAQCQSGGEGGILALPARDTVKRAGPGGTIDTTVPRDDIWLAQTPQCFPADQLRDALRRALADAHPVTDEASAMTYAGYPVSLVRGHWQNGKLTEPDDWPLMEWVLKSDD